MLLLLLLVVTLCRESRRQRVCRGRRRQLSVWFFFDLPTPNTQLRSRFRRHLPTYLHPPDAPRASDLPTYPLVRQERGIVADISRRTLITVAALITLAVDHRESARWCTSACR